MEILLDPIVEQVPSLAVLCYLVGAFLKQGREAIDTLSTSLAESVKEFAKAIDNLADTLKDKL